MLTEQQLLWKKWNHQGLFPGPNELENDFIDRVSYCQKIRQILIDKVSAELPFDLTDQSTQAMLNETFAITEELYDIAPSWVLLFCHNYHLAPWHGGCAWIFQIDEHSPISAFLQIRAQFRSTPNYLWRLYQRRELIAHELSHIGRMAYQEPQFEELFAYQSSRSSWRRWLGPIVQSSKETLIFIFLLALIFMTDFALFFAGEHPTVVLAFWMLKALPLLLIFFGMGRLILRHRTYQKALTHLEQLYNSKEKAKYLLYRLKDDEIKQMAHSSPNQIKFFLSEAPTHSFRWHFLTTIYPIDDISSLE